MLVNGASGAVGTAMVQLAKAAGAHVTGVSSTANQALVASLGADRTIDYATHDFAEDGSTYDVIVDCAGNAPVARVRQPEPGRRRPSRGRRPPLDHHGGQSGPPTRHHRDHGTWSNRSEDLEYLVDLANEGICSTIDRTFPFDEISEAHRFVDSGRKRGSVVVNVVSR